VIPYSSLARPDGDLVMADGDGEMVIIKALEIKIPFLAVFRHLSVVFPVALNKH